MEKNETKCFLVFGLRRTGNHAIINWICRQMTPSAHYNNCVIEPIGNIRLDPLKKFYEKDKVLKKEPKGRSLSYYKLVVYNFENQLVKDVSFGVKLLKIRTENIKYIVITRDPYNLFASRLRSSREGHRFIDVWKSHVHLCMENKDIIGINFNKWFSEKNYRIELAEKLGLKFTDKGINDVFWFGASSFDGNKFDGKAQNMEVLERWKNVIGSSVLEKKYKQIVNDPSIRKLSEEFFNFTPGGENGE